MHVQRFCKREKYIAERKIYSPRVKHHLICFFHKQFAKKKKRQCAWALTKWVKQADLAC